jgi:hypothetical protein
MTTNTDKRIHLYFYICDCFQRNWANSAQRLSNNDAPEFTDEEIITIFLYGIIVEKRHEIQLIYQLAHNYLRSWFPLLGTYEAFVMRLNRLCDVFQHLLPTIIEDYLSDWDPQLISTFQGLMIGLVDSMPIIVAQGSRSYSAKVAPKLCKRGVCATKKLTYYGLKLHFMGLHRAKQLPLPFYVEFTSANESDITVMKPVLESLENMCINGDKIYHNQEMVDFLQAKRNVLLVTPIKKKKGQKELSFVDKCLSYVVSANRQPVERFFNWIQQTTGIQSASKVRSPKGLLVHVFGRLAAAFLLLLDPVL